MAATAVASRNVVSAARAPRLPLSQYDSNGRLPRSPFLHSRKFQPTIHFFPISVAANQQSRLGIGKCFAQMSKNEWLEFSLHDNASSLSKNEEKTSEQPSITPQEEIIIRRRPPLGPSSHPVGSFEFRISGEENIPRNILEEIVWNKDAEVSKMKEKMPLSTLLKSIPNVAPPKDFLGALKSRYQETDLPGLIAEVKKASPSKGVIQPDFDPVRIAKAYEKGGAACLSVLTDSKYFQGSFENLKLIQSSGVQCPLLCKEFIIDAWQIYFARLKGADAILLIASVLPDQDLRYMTKIAKNLGMTSLVEVHTEKEMDRVLSLENIELVGINNRDLGTFKVDIHNTERLLAGGRGQRIRDRNILVVAESGLFTPDDITLVKNAGCKAVLVGESIVKQKDPTTGITNLMGKSISREIAAEDPSNAGYEAISPLT